MYYCLRKSRLLQAVVLILICLQDLIRIKKKKKKVYINSLHKLFGKSWSSDGPKSDFCVLRNISLSLSSFTKRGKDIFRGKKHKFKRVCKTEGKLEWSCLVTESVLKRFFHGIPFLQFSKSSHPSHKWKDKGSSFVPAYQSCQLGRDHKKLRLWVSFAAVFLCPQAFFPWSLIQFAKQPYICLSLRDFLLKEAVSDYVYSASASAKKMRMSPKKDANCNWTVCHMVKGKRHFAYPRQMFFMDIH